MANRPFSLTPRVALLSWVCAKAALPAAPDPLAGTADVSFHQSAPVIECYDFVEVTINVAKPRAHNPFTDVIVAGHFERTGEDRKVAVDGFCDSTDGSLFRIRFMPRKAGDYTCLVTYSQGDLQHAHKGDFRAVAGHRRGLLRIDFEHPWHFRWEGTGEHYFLNGTTAFLLLGWEDEQVIRDCIDRLHGLEVNRLRVLLDGRTDHFWGEPIKPNAHFRAHLNPWLARRPEDVASPDFDYTRFNCPYWQKYERMLQYCRDKDIIVSIIFGWNDTPVHPAAGGDDEKRYFRYALARLGAYSNVTWDLGDDLDGFRDEAWTHTFGTMLYQNDPYQHLATSHPIKNSHQDLTSPWLSMTSFQEWNRPLHGWMLSQRRQQVSTGRIIPQLNEEYGYEDHYPAWAPYHPPTASADANRREAWGIAMAGCYQTTGETAKRGTGIAPDTGGGWVNGRGDSSMTMLNGYARMVRFFGSFEWWKTEPNDELVNAGAFCLAEPGILYVAYLPHGRPVTMKLNSGRYATKWYNPRTGGYSAIADAEGLTWTSPAAPDAEDWVLLLKRIPGANK